MGPTRCPPPGRYTIERNKLVAYLLDPTHPDGGSKALHFLAHGFGTHEIDLFADALLGHALVEGHLKRTIVSHWGVKFVYEGPIEAPDGELLMIRTVWMGDDQGGEARLVTALPRRR